MTMLKVEGLTKVFGGLTAVSDVSFSVSEGTIFGLIGPNGAGKTTVFNQITGIYQPTSGKIEVEGQSLVGLKPNQIARAGVARTFQNLRLFRKLTVMENVMISCQHDCDYNLLTAVLRNKAYKQQEKRLKEEAGELLSLIGLEQYASFKAGNLPYGHQRRLEIARAMALNPKILLLDEPAAGMNPEESLVLLEFIREIKDRFGLTILLIEHHMEIVMGICDHIVVLNFGKEIANGTAAEIQNNPEVITAYLGEEAAEDA
ncbi:MAG: ABC transporter ATP-binding protein [Peptococcaceae bacterium]|nr:ABC transporter ATP-binding protein [Peptococcaceae bacterium]